MRPRRRMRPGVEALESKHAPSAGPAALSGLVSGTYFAPNETAPAGRAQTLQGMGTVAPLGTVSIAGSLHSTQGRAAGSLTFTGSLGSVTVQLRGAAPRPGVRARPSAGAFTITGGTGAFAAASGSGTVTLTETPERHPTSHPGAATPDFIVAPMFTLTLDVRTARDGK